MHTITTIAEIIATTPILAATAYLVKKMEP